MMVGIAVVIIVGGDMALGAWCLVLACEIVGGVQIKDTVTVITELAKL